METIDYIRSNLIVELIDGFSWPYKIILPKEYLLENITDKYSFNSFMKFLKNGIQKLYKKKFRHRVGYDFGIYIKMLAIDNNLLSLEEYNNYIENNIENEEEKNFILDIIDFFDVYIKKSKYKLIEKHDLPSEKYITYEVINNESEYNIFNKIISNIDIGYHQTMCRSFIYILFYGIFGNDKIYARRNDYGLGIYFTDEQLLSDSFGSIYTSFLIKNKYIIYFRKFN